ncbi:hypothetical protein AB0M48_18030 [Lentzea sp. NPDC051208]|uniref:hypothetical protein n=1 Tax=Lentzea sp. NPDC051208 TaxID=3154642 RepID=UPI003441191A
MLEAAKSLRVNDPLIPKWQDTLAHLTPYPVDANGYMIGAGVPFYPLYEVTWEDTAQRQLIETSLNHWVSFEGALQGYTFTGAASISAQMLRGDKADFCLGELMRRYRPPSTHSTGSRPCWAVGTRRRCGRRTSSCACRTWTTARCGATTNLKPGPVAGASAPSWGLPG